MNVELYAKTMSEILSKKHDADIRIHYVKKRRQKGEEEYV